MKICYTPRKFAAEALSLIATANKIISEYKADGYDLTLRQVYYQFVARKIIANKDSEYKRLGSIINDARLAGMIDWDAIIDRTRNLRKNSHWDSPAEIVNACASQYQVDKWDGNPTYVEVWIEKDALVGIVESVCAGLDVPFFSCRGYTSQSEMWEAGQRLARKAERNAQETVIIHLGDHDPSGKDMSRDIEERLALFMDHAGQIPVRVERIALNMDQIEEYGPPPNPAKITDSRARKYIDEFGAESWELDALEPRVLSSLIENAVNAYLDDDIWEKNKTKELKHKKQLLAAASKMKA